MDPDLVYQVLAAVLALVATVAGKWLSRVLQVRFTAEQLMVAQQIARAAMLFVEQVFTTVKGDEKLRPAIIRARQLAESYGVKLTDEQWRTLIETALKDFKEQQAWLKARSTSGG